MEARISMPVLSHRRSVCEKAVAALAAGDRSALAPLLGITVAAAQKRYQRAMEKLRAL